MYGFDVLSTLNFFNGFDVLSASMNSTCYQLLISIFSNLFKYFSLLSTIWLIIRSRLLRQRHSVILLFRWRPKFFLLICLLILIVRIPNFQKSCIGILIVHYILVDFFGFSSNFTAMNYFDMLSIPNLQRIFYL